MTSSFDETGGPPVLAIDGGVATVTLRRPAQHNRIDPADIVVLRDHLSVIATRNDVVAIVFTGTGGKTFSSGYTLDAIVERLDRGFEDLLDSVENVDLPTIAALNGSVYGGATDLALCCDFRIGVRGSRMFMPAARFGLHYYPGGLRRYTTILGTAQAKRLFLTAQTIDATEMLRIGFLTELVDADALAARVSEYLADIKACDTTAVRSMKRQLNAVAAASHTGDPSRDDYDASLRSGELRKRLGALLNRDAP